VDTLSDQLRAASSWTPESQDNLLARDLFATPHSLGESESNIRYLFPRASGSHPRGV
jgi:hypothetical protein